VQTDPHRDSTPSLSVRTFLDETPTTVTTSLPTPSRPPPITDVLHIFDPDHHRTPFERTVMEWQLQPPPAPKLKDMDSFTEGTAVGSFDFSLRSSCSSEHLSNRPFRDPPPLNPSSLDPCAREIEMWRDEVLLSTLPGPETADDTAYCESSIGPPTSRIWRGAQSRPPKRQLSSTSLDTDHRRGRKLSRLGGGVFRSRSWNVSPELDCDRPARPSSAPDFLPSPSPSI
jgi:hypothetical protein